MVLQLVGLQLCSAFKLRHATNRVPQRLRFILPKQEYIIGKYRLWIINLCRSPWYPPKQVRGQRSWWRARAREEAYGGSYSYVTYSGNIIRNEIGVMRFPCNEIAMSDGFEMQNLAPTVPKTVHANDLSLETGILLVVKSLHSSRNCWTCSHLCVRTL